MRSAPPHAVDHGRRHGDVPRPAAPGILALEPVYRTKQARQPVDPSAARAVGHCVAARAMDFRLATLIHELTVPSYPRWTTGHRQGSGASKRTRFRPRRMAMVRRRSVYSLIAGQSALVGAEANTPGPPALYESTQAVARWHTGPGKSGKPNSPPRTRIGTRGGDGEAQRCSGKNDTGVISRFSCCSSAPSLALSSV